MNKLNKELRRLYLPPGCQVVDGKLELTTPNGLIRALLFGFGLGRDWPAVAALLQGVQDELALPLPGLSVSVPDGFQVWFSLAEPVPLELALQFLAGVQEKYLADFPVERLRSWPRQASGAEWVWQVPALDATSGRWSAFIDPGMGSMFVDELGLDIMPNMERQADLLAGLQPISALDFGRIMAGMSRQQTVPSGPVDTPGPVLKGSFANPQDFLLAVMNDASASLSHRIEAAKALLMVRTDH